MKVTVLKSGSKGNSTLIEADHLNILLDAGITLKELESYDKDNIDVILITHSHTDHTSGLKSIYKKYKPIIYTRNNDVLADENYKTTYLEKTFILDNLEIISFNLSHDSDCIGFLIKDLNDNNELVYITDTGYINSKILDKIVNKNVYIMESNHDIDMLRHGKYPFFLQQRILSDKGHLSNKDCSKYLSKLIGDKTNTIILAHLSEENNTSELALKELEKMLIKNNLNVTTIYVAKQKESLAKVEV